tara:strand:- start:1472 stop:1702 length:231 start_codon:yes stop_codon:yes gene_type:complete
MTKHYRVSVHLKGSTNILLEKEGDSTPDWRDVWNSYRYDNSVHPDDLDIEIIEIYETDEDFNELKEVELPERTTRG